MMYMYHNSVRQSIPFHSIYVASICQCILAKVDLFLAFLKSMFIHNERFILWGVFFLKFRKLKFPFGSAWKKVHQWNVSVQEKNLNSVWYAYQFALFQVPSASYIFMITPWLHKSFCPMYNPCESQIELSDTSLVFARASRLMFCLLQWMLSINTQATFRRLEDQTCLNVMAWEMTGWVWKRESWREEKLYWKASGCEAVTNGHVSCTSLSSLGTVKYYLVISDQRKMASAFFVPQFQVRCQFKYY